MSYRANDTQNPSEILVSSISAVDSHWAKPLSTASDVCLDDFVTSLFGEKNRAKQ